MKKITALILTLLITLCCSLSVGCSNTVEVTFRQEGQQDIIFTVEKGQVLTDIPTPVQSSDTSIVTEWNVAENFIVNENTVIDAIEYTSGLNFEIDSFENIKYFKVASYSGASTTVIIPYSYRGITVGIIGKSAFRQRVSININLEKVVLPEGLVWVQEWAFCNTAVGDINVPSTLKKVDYQGFSNAQPQGENGVLTIPAGLQIISERAFFCADANRIVVPEGITYIDKHGLSYCRSATELFLPKSLTSIHGLSLIRGSFDKIYYAGSEIDWLRIEIGDEVENNNNFQQELDDGKYTIFYYSENQPLESGNYWHFVNDEPVIW